MDAIKSNDNQSANCCLATVSASHVTFVSKLQKATISSVMFVSLYAWSNLTAFDAFS